MSEFLSALHGACVMLSAVAVCVGWYLSYKSHRVIEKTKQECTKALADFKEISLEIAKAHNEIVQTQAELGQTIERLSADVASRSLRR